MSSLWGGLVARISGQPWGAWAVVNLVLSLFSGLILGLQYDYATPFYSTTAIDTLAPYGAYLRSLHFFSSQFFFLCSSLHLLVVYQRCHHYPTVEWLRLLATLPVILLLLFTGYILRGDATGYSAGAIAEKIMLTIPGIGEQLNNLLFSLGESGLRKVYLHHVITFDLLFLMLAWQHLRRYWPPVAQHSFPLFLTLMICALMPAPMEPEVYGVSYISGPWFFLGLQELLRYLPPFFAGVLLPLSMLSCLLATHPAWSVSHNMLRVTWALMLCYIILTVIAWMR